MTFDPRHPLLLACKDLGAAFDLRDAEISAELGISRNELRLLNFLEDGPRSQVDIAAHLLVSRAAVTSMVDTLTAHGLVKRSPSTEDRRVKLVSLTPKVWQVLSKHYGPSGRRVLDAASELGDAEVRQMVRYIETVSHAIHPKTAEAHPRLEP